MNTISNQMVFKIKKQTRKHLNDARCAYNLACQNAKVINHSSPTPTQRSLARAACDRARSELTIQIILMERLLGMKPSHCH